MCRLRCGTGSLSLIHISDIERHYKEICKERGIDPHAKAEPETAPIEQPADAAQAVSYTHLDVYKRQLPVMPFSSIGIWMVPQTMWELLSAPMAAVFIPVSYTHLDVYKRQEPG